MISGRVESRSLKMAYVISPPVVGAIPVASCGWPNRNQIQGWSGKCHRTFLVKRNYARGRPVSCHFPYRDSAWHDRCPESVQGGIVIGNPLSKSMLLINKHWSDNLAFWWNIAGRSQPCLFCLLFSGAVFCLISRIGWVSFPILLRCNPAAIRLESSETTDRIEFLTPIYRRFISFFPHIYGLENIEHVFFILRISRLGVRVPPGAQKNSPIFRGVCC